MKQLLWMMVACALVWPGQTVGACGQGEAPGQSAAAAGREAPSEVSRPVVEVLEAGAEPRRALRYDPVIGRTERATIETRIASSASANGRESPRQTLPAVTMTMRLTPTAADDSGIAYRFLFEDARAAQGHEASAMMNEAVAPLVGVAGEGMLSQRGESLAFEPQGLAGLPAMLQEQIQSMSAQASQICLVLPEEPIGVGARWRIITTLTNGGMEMQHTTTATLQSMDGDALRIALAFEQSAPEQEFSPPQMGGREVRLLSFQGTGSGHATASLHRIVPLRSAQSIETRMRMDLDGAGEQTAEMSMSMTVRGEVIERDEKDEDAPGAAGVDASGRGGSAG